MEKKLKFQLLEDKFAISKLPSFAELPAVFREGEMCFIMRTDEDLTIISPEFMAPNNVQQEVGFRCIRTVGEKPANGNRLISFITKPLEDNGIGFLTVSTFNTDYIFLPEENLAKATQLLHKLGHEFVVVE